ncbi:MAG: hypothetical protein BroJett018_21290 [Chloroflexota bacterium]|nr:hypothetical protein [Chloroflexota bacterium]NOG65422.1 hypothetical protein [Chloroflexota bacterium]GIK64335.1 MAG: hypothetical protein BroJett018_21290 [Chloroflexota bacterium]
MCDENPPPPRSVLYSPPAPEAVDAFARQVCQRLGADYTDKAVVEGFSAFIKIVADIQAKHLNKQGQNVEAS